MSSKIDLVEMFNKCVADVNGDKTRGAQRLIISAKKADPTVTIQECMDAAGFKSDDEKKAKALEQDFRLKVFNPVRDQLTIVKMNQPDPKKIFGRVLGTLTDEEKKSRASVRQAVLSMLPSAGFRSAQASTTNMDHLSDLI